MKSYWLHFKTITKHKWYVMIACFKCGLIWQGITHDLSKYSLAEFLSSARYFQGDKSPLEAEKAAKGYSVAWQNHKSKNKHHWHYWTDIEQGKTYAIKMPGKYIAEMVCDWIGAGKAYNKGKWTVDTLKTWYGKQKMVLHNDTRIFIDRLIADADSEESIYTNLRML
jgi:hypothetical protein